jgi:hypothetical protein
MDWENLMNKRSISSNLDPRYILPRAQPKQSVLEAFMSVYREVLAIYREG